MKIKQNLNKDNSKDAIIWLDRYCREYQGLNKSLSINNFSNLELMMLENALPSTILNEFETIAKSPYDVIVGSLDQNNSYNTNIYCNGFLLGAKKSLEVANKYRIKAKKKDTVFYDKNIYCNNQTEFLKEFGLNTIWKTDADQKALLTQIKNHNMTIVNYKRKVNLPTKSLLIKKMTGEYFHFVDPEFEFYYSNLNSLEKDNLCVNNFMKISDFLKRWKGGYRVIL